MTAPLRPTNAHDRLDRVTGQALAATFAACLLIGGGGAHAPWFDAALSLSAAVLLGLAAAAHVSGARRLAPAFAPLLMLFALWLLLLALQLLPLMGPASCDLDPVRAAACASRHVIGERPISSLTLHPSATVMVVAGLLVPAALLVGLAGATRKELGGLRRIALACAGVAAALALVAKAAHGSGIRLFDVRENSDLGLFANPNHFGGAMLAAAILAAFPIAGTSDRARRLALLLSLFFLVMATASQSRAAILLAALLAVALLLSLAAPFVRRRRMPLALAGLLVIAGAAIVLLRASGTDPVHILGFEQEQRFRLLPYLADMAVTTAPWGTGFGSFRQAWQVVEPLHTIDGFQLNHAHNDYLQLLIEGGAIAGLLLLALLVAIAQRVHAVRRHRPIRREAIAGLALLMLTAIYSLFDYPLRTTALAALALLGLALLFHGDDRTEPRPRARPSPASRTLSLGLLLASLAAGAGAATLFAARTALVADRPALAEELWSNDPERLDAEALRALQSGNPAAAHSAALAAARRAPLSVAALRDLALARAALGKPADDVIRAATRLGWNDPYVQWQAFVQAFDAGDRKTAARHADAILRAIPPQPALRSSIAMFAAADPAFAGRLAARARSAPPWRKRWFDIAAHAEPVERAGVAAVFDALARTGSPTAASEWSSVFNARLDFDQGGAVRMARALPQAAPAITSAAKLSAALSLDRPPTAFDWRTPQSDGIVVDPTVGADRIEASIDPFARGEIVRRWMVAPPGALDFAVVLGRTEGDLSGVALEIRCQPGDRLLASVKVAEQRSGTLENSPCPLVSLTLRADPSDTARVIEIIQIGAKSKSNIYH